MICGYCKKPDCKLGLPAQAGESDSDTFKRYWREFKEIIIWPVVILNSILLLICCLIFGWWGLLIFWLLDKGMSAGGGAWTVGMYAEPKELPKTKCVAGNIDCEICDSSTGELNLTHNKI